MDGLGQWCSRIGGYLRLGKCSSEFGAVGQGRRERGWRNLGETLVVAGAFSLFPSLDLFECLYWERGMWMEESRTRRRRVKGDEEEKKYKSQRSAVANVLARPTCRHFMIENRQFIQHFQTRLRPSIPLTLTLEK